MKKIITKIIVVALSLLTCLGAVGCSTVVPEDYTCEHSYSASVLYEANSVLSGLIKYECDKCGHSFQSVSPKTVDLQAEPCSHEYALSVLKDATTDAEGLHEYTCTKCSFKQLKAVPKLAEKELDATLTCEHDYAFEYLLEPSKLKNGLLNNECSKCGHSFMLEIPKRAEAIELYKHTITITKDDNTDSFYLITTSSDKLYDVYWYNTFEEVWVHDSNYSTLTETFLTGYIRTSDFSIQGKIISANGGCFVYSDYLSISDVKSFGLMDFAICLGYTVDQYTTGQVDVIDTVTKL